MNEKWGSQNDFVEFVVNDRLFKFNMYPRGQKKSILWSIGTFEHILAGSI